MPTRSSSAPSCCTRPGGSFDATEIEQVDNQANASTVRTFAPNPMAGNYRVVSSRLLRARLSTAGEPTSNWYLGNFRKAFAYMENWGITVTQAPQNSEAEFTQDIMIRFKASERAPPRRSSRDTSSRIRRKGSWTP